ncbi:MAG TPA: acyltransferase [Micromonospora sp.]
MRSRYLDLLRSLAIVRVVVYHVTGWAGLTLVFPAMSVMFAVAGSLMAASLDRCRIAERSGLSAVGRRLRRLLPSLWVVAAVFVPAMLVAGGVPVSWRLVFWLVPLGDLPANEWGTIALGTLWYLRDYLWFVLLSPVALRLFRRWPLPTLVAPYLLLVAVESGLLETGDAVVRDVGLYFGAWLLGFAHHDGLLRRWSRPALLAVAGVAATAGGLWLLTHPGDRGYDLNEVPLGNALWSGAFILVLLGLAPTGLPRLARSGPVDRAVTLLNRRALTVYLWHMPAIVLLTPLLGRVGWTHNDPVGLTVRLTAVLVCVGLAVLALGWVEDLAGRRRPVLLPGGSTDRTPSVPASPSAPNSAGAPASPSAPGHPLTVMSPLPECRSSRIDAGGSCWTPIRFSPEDERDFTR